MPVLLRNFCFLEKRLKPVESVRVNQSITDVNVQQEEAQRGESYKRKTQKLSLKCFGAEVHAPSPTPPLKPHSVVSHITLMICKGCVTSQQEHAWVAWNLIQRRNGFLQNLFSDTAIRFLRFLSLCRCYFYRGNNWRLPKIELELHCRISARPSLRESHWHKVERFALRFHTIGLNPMFSSIQLQHESDPLDRNFLRKWFELSRSGQEDRHCNADHTVSLFADRGVEELEVYWRHACHSRKIPWTGLGDRLSCL